VAGSFDVSSSYSFSSKTKSLTSASAPTTKTLSFSGSSSMFSCGSSGSLTLSYLDLDLYGTVGADGGGFYLENNHCAVTISYCTIRDAQGSNGGVMYIKSGMAAFQYSTFTSNTGSNGGVVYVDDDGQLDVEYSTFTSNLASNVRSCGLLPSDDSARTQIDGAPAMSGRRYLLHRRRNSRRVVFQFERRAFFFLPTVVLGSRTR
jgi:hypothetical protein